MKCFVAFDSFNSRQIFGIPIGMSCAIERIDDIMESVTTLTELKRLSSCINAILNMASSSLLKKFERKAGQVLDDTDRLTSIDQGDFNSLVKIGTILGDLSFGKHGYERDHWGSESLYKIFKLIYDNVEKLRDDHIANSSLSMISQRSGIFAPLSNKLHDLEWERYKTLRDTLHLRRVASKFSSFSKLLANNNPHVTADEKKRVIGELLDIPDAFSNSWCAEAANTILLSDFINRRETELIVNKLDNSPSSTAFFVKLRIRANYISVAQMSVLSKRSLEYISPSYPRVRSPHIFISQLSIILQIPGAAASIDAETLDRSINMINYAEPKTLECLLDVLDLPVVTVLSYNLITIN